jgi:hypothetical protein
MKKFAMPACTKPATNRFELFSPANGQLCGTLDGVVRTCDAHAPAARAAAAAMGMSAWTVAGPFNDLGTCGRITDYDVLLGPVSHR